jgi:hypothetical protein
MAAKNMITTLDSMALMVMSAGSTAGPCGETTRPGGGASHTVGSELAAEDDIVRTEVFSMLYDLRKKVDLLVLQVIMGY